jgi:hypothetical protein
MNLRIKEVYDDASFEENAVKEVVELLKCIRRYTVNSS